MRCRRTQTRLNVPTLARTVGSGHSARFRAEVLEGGEEADENPAGEHSAGVISGLCFYAELQTGQLTVCCVVR